jgi:hypothetical protein
MKGKKVEAGTPPVYKANMLPCFSMKEAYFIN